MKKLKQEIENLSKTQTFLKNQRKTVNLVGERTVDPWDATYSYMNNKFILRLMYAAYGLMRGKSFSQTENRYSEEEHPLNEFKKQITNLISKYHEKEVVYINM